MTVRLRKNHHWLEAILGYVVSYRINNALTKPSPPHTNSG